MSLHNIWVDPEVVTDREEVTVLVTGYGPFLDKFPVNASWSIASRLPPYLSLTASLPIPIRIVVPPKPLRVSYSHVASVAPKLLSGTYPLHEWTETSNGAHTLPKPDIVLHIGLAAGRTFYTLERQARGGQFNRIKDVDGHIFPEAEAKKLFASCPDVLKPTFDTEDVWRRWRTFVVDPTADLRPSDDPGIYLCGFIYYVSMAWYWKRSLEMQEEVSDSNDRPVCFLHVPDLPTEDEVEQGRQVAIGLIKALVASRERRGMVDPLKPPENERSVSGGSSVGESIASVKPGWDGVSDFPKAE